MYIKNILSDSGLVHKWLNQANAHLNISKSVNLKLTEIHSISWKTDDFDSSKCLNYRSFKPDFGFENYFNVLPDDLSKAFCHFRSLNHKMPIEWGRYLGTQRDDSIYELCRMHKIGNEFHYMLECTYFDDTKNVYLPRSLTSRHNVNVFHDIMNSRNTQTFFKVAKFSKTILKTFQEIFRNI